MTPSSRIGSLACAAAGLFLLVVGRGSTIAAAAPSQAGSEPLPPLYVPPAPAVGTRHLRSSEAAFGQVDVFIDLACPKSAASWPTLKRIVRDHRHRADFVFHILPLSENPIGFFAAKAVQVILANSDGTYDDVERFIDWVFRGQRIVLYEQDLAMAIDAQEIVMDWALSTSSLSHEKLSRDMKDPVFDEKVLDYLENRFLAVDVTTTPTVLFNGIFMMSLVGEKQLQDFEIFLEDSDFSSSSYDGIYAADVYGTPAWKELEREARDDYSEMQRERKALQAARELRRFEQVEKRVQQQLHDLDVQQQDQLKQLLHLQQDQLKQLLLQRDQMTAGMQRPATGLPPASPTSSSLGFYTPRHHPASYYSAVSPDYDHLSSPYSASSSSSSSSSSSTATASSSSLSSSSSRPYPEPPAPSSPPGPTQSTSWSWYSFSSSVSSLFSSDRQEEASDEPPPSAEDVAFAEAVALAADWAARRDDQQQYLRQQGRQQQDYRAERGWLAFFRNFGWPSEKKVVAARGEETTPEGSSGGAGGVGRAGRPGGRGGESPSEADQEGKFINFEEAAADDEIAVKL